MIEPSAAQLTRKEMTMDKNTDNGFWYAVAAMSFAFIVMIAAVILRGGLW